jgi:hypothetical protein
MRALAWCWYCGSMLAGALLFWIPPRWWLLAWTPAPLRLAWLPLGLTFVAILCALKSWTPTAELPTIKPLPGRQAIDSFRPRLAVIFNREDGDSGRFAVGSWSGFYNPDGTRWLALCWNCRNWLAGFNYLTWPWASAAPNLQLPYLVPAWVPRIGGTRRTLRLGWQQLPAGDGWVLRSRPRMVCSA